MTCAHCGSTESVTIAGKAYCGMCGQPLAEKAAVSHTAPAPKLRKSAPPIDLRVIESAKAARQPARPQAAPAVARSEQIDTPPEKPRSIAPQASSHASQSRRFESLETLRDSLRASRLPHIAVPVILMTAVSLILHSLFFITQNTRLSTFLTALGKGTAGNTASLTALIGLLTWLGTFGLISYLTSRYLLTYCIVTASKHFDRRNVREPQLQRTSLAGMAKLFGLDIINGAALSLTLGLGILINIGFLGTKALGSGGVLLAWIANCLIVLLLVGLTAVRVMASFATILGRVPLKHAVATGFGLLRHRLAAFGGAVLPFALLAMLISTPALLSVQALLAHPNALWALTALILTSLTEAVVLILGALYWLRFYRYELAHQIEAPEVHVLSGRQPAPLRLKRQLTKLTISLVLWLSLMSLVGLSAPGLASWLSR